MRTLACPAVTVADKLLERLMHFPDYFYGNLKHSSHLLAVLIRAFAHKPVASSQRLAPNPA
ncbi:MAG: hypothetical protein NZM43_04750 [Saprospiraceae bacterium]|nr:hypothetical protein [Saprospiraceae bacterium]MDW8483617.1 hypothetical protein [Saprospiraceae bacterium]